MKSKGLGLRRATPLAVCITLSLKNIAKEHAASREAGEDKKPQKEANELVEGLCGWVVVRIQFD